MLAPYAMATVRKTGGPADRALGAMSYEVYLIHGAALGVLYQHTIGLSHFKQLPQVGIMLLATAALALAIYHLIDKPAERLRRAYVRRQPKLMLDKAWTNALGEAAAPSSAGIAD